MLKILCKKPKEHGIVFMLLMREMQNETTMRYLNSTRIIEMNSHTLLMEAKNGRTILKSYLAESIKDINPALLLSGLYKKNTYI